MSKWFHLFILILFCHVLTSCQFQAELDPKYKVEADIVSSENVEINIPNDELSVSSFESQFRTYYESLPLQTPQSSVETFIQAFQTYDFATVYMVLAPASQQALGENKALLQQNNLIVTPSEEFQRAWFERATNPEHIYDTRYSYELFLTVASEYGLLPINLQGSIDILATTYTDNSLSQPMAEMVTKVEGMNEEIVFRLTQSPSGRWRVLQVIWSGSDSDQIPWAIQQESLVTPSNNISHHAANRPINYYQSLDLSTPEKTIEIFASSFREKDFPTVFLLLHPETQFEWSKQFSTNNLENIVSLEQKTAQQVLSQMDMTQRLYLLEDSGLVTADESLLIFREMTGSRLTHAYTPLVMEHIGDTSYVFDQVMMAANEEYLIGLHRPINILDITLVSAKSRNRQLP